MMAVQELYLQAARLSPDNIDPDVQVTLPALLFRYIVS